jgi:hypothetical protein
MGCVILLYCFGSGRLAISTVLFAFGDQTRVIFASLIIVIDRGAGKVSVVLEEESITSRSVANDNTWLFSARHTVALCGFRPNLVNLGYGV